MILTHTTKCYITLKNRIKKLEVSQIKFNQNLVNISARSQRILEFRKLHFDVNWFIK